MIAIRAGAGVWVAALVWVAVGGSGVDVGVAVGGTTVFVAVGGTGMAVAVAVMLAVAVLVTVALGGVATWPRGDAAATVKLTSAGWSCQVPSAV